MIGTTVLLARRRVQPDHQKTPGGTGTSTDSTDGGIGRIISTARVPGTSAHISRILSSTSADFTTEATSINDQRNISALTYIHSHYHYIQCAQTVHIYAKRTSAQPVLSHWFKNIHYNHRDIIYIVLSKHSLRLLNHYYSSFFLYIYIYIRFLHMYSYYIHIYY